MHRGAAIIVVEDEVLIAMTIMSEIEDEGGLVIGPAFTTAEALELIDECLASEVPIAGAILDANLIDRDVTPVALRLLDLGVPIVIHSATGPPAQVLAVTDAIPWIPKPMPVAKLVSALCQEIARAQKTDVVDQSEIEPAA